jgi:hypothetical protein
LSLTGGKSGYAMNVANYKEGSNKLGGHAEN